MARWDLEKSLRVWKIETYVKGLDVKSLSGPEQSLAFTGSESLCSGSELLLHPLKAQLVSILAKNQLTSSPEPVALAGPR